MKQLILALSIIFAFTLSASNSTSEIGKAPEEKPINDSNKNLDENKVKASQGGSAEAEKTVKIGNLAFPVSQQPSPLTSFGQNIFDKKQAQALLLTNEFKGDDQYLINMVPTLIYCFTDSLSIFTSAPHAVRYRDDGHHSSGPGDALIQLEYAFYTKAYKTYYDQATIVANVTIPTGSTKKNPPTGIGSNSFFIGATYSRMKVDWFYFASTGGVLTGSSHRTQFGNQFLYQFGFGRRIWNSKEWLFDWMFEFAGVYLSKNKIQGQTDPNSGGNVIYLTPSLWISSSESFLMQLGIGFPVVQNLFGHQHKIDYLLSLNLGWTF